jgi:hypothetical protein
VPRRLSEVAAVDERCGVVLEPQPFLVGVDHLRREHGARVDPLRRLVAPQVGALHRALGRSHLRLERLGARPCLFGCLGFWTAAEWDQLRRLLASRGVTPDDQSTALPFLDVSHLGVSSVGQART